MSIDSRLEVTAEQIKQLNDLLLVSDYKQSKLISLAGLQELKTEISFRHAELEEVERQLQYGILNLRSSYFRPIICLSFNRKT